MLGYSKAELDDMQAKWALRFPPDLIDCLRPSGRWAIHPRREPVEITSGDLFRIEVGGELHLQSMSLRHQ
jgi:hypothetical protein